MSDFFWKAWSVVIFRPRFKHFGARSWIRKPLVIKNAKSISIGSGCFIRDGARLEVVVRPGLQSGSLAIGNNVSMEQGVHIAACGSVVIEDEVCFGPRCTVVDTTHPVGQSADGNRVRSLSVESTSIHIGRRVFLGANVVVLPNVIIGENCIVGANSVVTHDLPANSIAAGCPARVLKSI